jgi:hypothetical protein
VVEWGHWNQIKTEPLASSKNKKNSYEYTH